MTNVKNQANLPQLRIFHGPENICGIGRYLADWQRNAKGVKSDFIVYRDNTPFQNSHQNLHLENLSSLKSLLMQINFFLHSLNAYDLFHFYFGKSLLPFNLDLPILKIFGKKIIINYVGSDIRLPSVEKKRNAFFHLRLEAEKSKSPPEFIKRISLKWQSLWFDRCLAPRNLYAHAIKVFSKKKIVHKIWTTNTMSLLESPPNFGTKQIPTILHAPTDPEKKGSKYIQNAIENLSAEGYQFNFLNLKNIPHEEMISIIKNEADIIIDSVLSGGYGNTAMEAMSFGKPVCGFVLDEIRSLNPDLPVIQITVDTIKEKLALLIDNPSERIRLGKEGWVFAKKHYDRNKTNEKLWDLYLEVLNE